MLVDQFNRPLMTEATKKQREFVRRKKNQIVERLNALNAAYDAAIDTEENRRHWRWADTNSAAAANSIEVRRKLRSRARYECLEANSFAKGICLTLMNDTINRGPTLQVQLQDTVVSRFVETEFKKWAKKIKLGAKLRTARLSKTVDGEIFILKTTNRKLKTPVQLDIRLVEADQISTPGFVDGMKPDEVDGIIFENGNPVTYHMLKSHPGDPWQTQAWEKDDIDADDMIHLFRCERPGQVRGVPEVTPALPLFAMLRRYTLAVIQAAETAADFAAILKTTASEMGDSDFDDELSAFDSTPIDRGMMTALPRGYEMQQFKPEQPTTTYEVFRNAILNEIARCVHMPSNKARADSSSYNYSSGRLDHQTYYEAIAVERCDWEIEALDRIFEWWLDEAFMLSNYIVGVDAMDEIPHEWRWPPNKDVNPSEIADSNIKLIDAGLKTRRDYLFEQNIDPEEHAAQLAREGWTNPNQAAASSSPLPGSTPAVDSVPTDDSGEVDPENGPPSQPSGEFKGEKRSSVKNASRAIDEAISKVQSGEWTPLRAKVYMSSVGWKDATIDALLSEVVSESEVKV